MRCRSRGTTLCFVGGKAFIHSEQRGQKTAHMPCRPGSRQASRTGVWHHRDGSGRHTGQRGAGEGRGRFGGGLKGSKGKQVHGRMDDICYTPCFRFPWRQDQTPLPSPYFLPLEQHSLTTRSQHGSRQTRVVEGGGLAALLRLPTPAFRLSALHICRTKAMFMLHL